MPDGSLRDIERRVAEDRAKLARTLDMLGETLTPERLKAEAAESASRYGSKLGAQVWATAHQNPAALAMVGTGLALLLSGVGKRTGHAGGAEDRAPPRDSPSANRMRAALDSGLDSLPPAARDRVLQARKAVLRAQEKVERRAAGPAHRANRVTRENSVATGAAAFGLGALVAALLPPTRQQDEMLGATRDALMAEARRALKAEISKLEEARRTIPSGTGRGTKSHHLRYSGERRPQP